MSLKRMVLLVTFFLASLPLIAYQDEGQGDMQDVVADRNLEVAHYPRCPEKIEPKLLMFFPHVMAIDSTSGEVRLKFVITKEGQTENIEILESSGGRNERAFRRSALRTAENWEYDPIRRACVHIETVEYHLGDS